MSDTVGILSGTGSIGNIRPSVAAHSFVLDGNPFATFPSTFVNRSVFGGSTMTVGKDGVYRSIDFAHDLGPSYPGASSPSIYFGNGTWEFMNGSSVTGSLTINLAEGSTFAPIGTAGQALWGFYTNPGTAIDIGSWEIVGSTPTIPLFSGIKTTSDGPTYTFNGLPPSERTISFDGSSFVIGINLGLTGYNPAQALIDTFVSGIESTWSDKYYIKDGALAYPLKFDIGMSFNNPNADFQIELRNTVGDVSGRWPRLRPDWNTWYTELGAVEIPGIPLPLDLGWTPATVERSFNYALGDFAAHEFGHILGLADEYTRSENGRCENLPLSAPLGLMGCWMVMSDGTIDLAPVQERYFIDILSDISNILGRSVEGFAPIVPFTDTGETYGSGHSDALPSAAAPEPSGIVLLIAGFGALSVALRRRMLMTQRAVTRLPQEPSMPPLA